MYEVMLKQKPRVAISDQNGVTVNTLAYTISATAGYMTSMFRPISVQTIGVRLYSGREVQRPVRVLDELVSIGCI